VALTYFQLKGEQFIAGANRDIYVGKSAKQIKDTLLSIERLDGPTSAVIQKGSDGAVNTVTSTVTGYLFGECLWEHLKKENKVSADASIIFCEERESNSECYLVIVSQGVVIYDAIIPPSLIDEYVSEKIKTSGQRFEIITHGDTPFPNEETSAGIGDIVLSSELIKSYLVLDAPCVDHVLALKRYLLLPIPSALERARMGVPKKAIYITLLALTVGYVIYDKIEPEQVIERVTNAVTMVDNYVGFNDKLTTPAHKDILTTMANAYEQLAQLPGIAIQSISFQQGQSQLVVKANAIAASNEKIHKMLTSSLWDVDFIEGQVFFTKDFEFKNRPKPFHIYDIKELLPVLLDGTFLIKGTLSVSDNQATRHYKRRPFTMTYEEKFFPSYKTQAIIDTFEKLPIYIESINITFTSSSRSTVKTNASLLGE